MLGARTHPSVSSAVLLVAAALIVAAHALAEPRAGGVDWLRREVTCSGVGAPRLREEVENVAVTRAGTERAARADARRACLEALRGVVIRRGETVGARLDRDPGAASAIERLVRSAPPRAPPRFFADGGVEVDLAVPLDGPVSRLLLAGEAAPGAVSSPVPDGATGLVVDASDLAVTPALGPRLLDEAGAEIYGPSMLTVEARASGGAGYAATVAAARSARAARTGAAPRLVKAIRADGPDLVLSERDAAEVRARPYLAAGKVAVVAPLAAR